MLWVHLLALLGGTTCTSSLKVVLKVVRKRHNLGDHLAGEVMEVLRQHDVGQVLVDARCGLDFA